MREREREREREGGRESEGGWEDVARERERERESVCMQCCSKPELLVIRRSSEERDKPWNECK